MCSAEKLISHQVGLLFQEFSPLYEEFNQKIEEMISAGLTDYWIKKCFNPRGRTRKPPEDIGPQVLTLEHLEDAFFVSLMPLIVSVVSFIIEVAIPIIKRILNRRNLWKT